MPTLERTTNYTVVRIHVGLEFYFSYSTLVAFRAHGFKVRRYGSSQTTRKHIDQMGCKDFLTLDDTAFKRALDEAFPS